MIGLTRRQHDLLAFITHYQADSGGRSPSFEEMLLGVGLAGKSGIYRLLGALEERGYIRRFHRRPRDIEILRPAVMSRAPDGAPLFFVSLNALGSRRGAGPATDSPPSAGPASSITISSARCSAGVRLHDLGDNR